MPSVLVHVTAEHYRQQIYGSCERCAVALAICDLLRPNVYANVWFESYRIEDAIGGIWAKSRHFPRKVIVAIGEIDAGRMEEPFSFRTTIPAECLRDEVSR